MFGAIACGGSEPDGAVLTPHGALKGVYLRTPADGEGTVIGPMTLGKVRLKREVCDRRPELRPTYAKLDETEFERFLSSSSLTFTKLRARADLFLYDIAVVPNAPPMRMRVALLPDAPAAGRELHEAILQHGPGSWGVHRSNLAVLGPIGDVSQIVGIAARTKLACWGVLSAAGLDDDFAIAGGYVEP